MRLLLIVFFIGVTFFLILENPVHADNCMDKLARGVINVLVSPLEFFQGIKGPYPEGSQAVEFSKGIFEGSYNTIKRFGAGIFEVVTFLVPFPKDYGPIIDAPAFLRDRD